MRFKRLRSKIDELREITSSWCDGEDISLLEMDMALDRVKQIYELLRFDSVGDEVAMEADVAADDEIGTVIDEVVERLAEDAAERELMREEEDAEQMVEQIVGDIVEDDSIALATEDVALNKRERYNRICSLYADEVEEQEKAEELEEEPAPEPTPEPIPEPEPEVEVEEPTAEEPIQPIEIIISELTISEPTIEIEEQPILRPSMAEGLTLNDRFLLSHDLFNDDMDALSEAIKQLDSQSSYDDAIIYIAENYSWDGASDGAQIMITLLKSRFKS